MAILAQAQGLIGLALILLIAWGLSENRRVRPSWRWIGGAVALQIAVAATLTLAPGVWQVLSLANHAVTAIETATLAGSSYMFGFIGGGEAPFVLKSGAAAPVVLAFQILPLIIVYSALAALAWHLGVLGALVRGFAWLLDRTLGVGGAAGMSAAANVFVGMVEAPVVVRPWLATMSRGELFVVMNCGMATVAGTVLVLYA
ncbi:MAG: Na+ dependent nucleoside transporter N-terminal domain-containing protein, partial [Phenylobacterium sp.]